MQRHSTDINYDIDRILSAIGEFDGACDPAFDYELEELERQCAELRLAHARDLN